MAGHPAGSRSGGIGGDRDHHHGLKQKSPGGNRGQLLTKILTTMTNVTNKSKENKPFSLFEATANLVRPQDPFSGVERMMSGAIENLYKMKLTYHIDEADIVGDTVEVRYCPEGEQNSADPVMYDEAIALEALQEYVEYWGLNQFVSDYILWGEAVQEKYTIDFEDYITDPDNLYHAVREYLNDGGDTI